MRDSIGYVKGDGIFDEGVWSFRSACERVQPRGLLSIEGVSLGLSPSFWKALSSPDTTRTGDTTVELKDEDTAFAVTINRHCFLYSSMSNSSKTTRRPIRMQAIGPFGAARS